MGGVPGRAYSLLQVPFLRKRGVESGGILLATEGELVVVVDVLVVAVLVEEGEEVLIVDAEPALRRYG